MICRIFNLNKVKRSANRDIRQGRRIIVFRILFELARNIRCVVLKNNFLNQQFICRRHAAEVEKPTATRIYILLPATQCICQKYLYRISLYCSLPSLNFIHYVTILLLMVVALVVAIILFFGIYFFHLFCIFIICRTIFFFWIKLFLFIYREITRGFYH